MLPDLSASSPDEIATQSLESAALRASLGRLDQREREVLCLRFGLSSEHPLTLEEVGRRFDLTRERIVAWLAFGFGTLTLLLAALGLYGVLSYGVTRRTQEIGVRMALGARRLEVLGLVGGQSARLTVMGVALGLLATGAVSRYLAGMLFGVTPLDPMTFVLVTLAFIVVAMLASYIPARRATNVDPLVALRCE